MASAGDLPIRGIYEVVVRVADLDRAQDFYCSTLGLDPGLMVDERGMRFLRAGNGGMLVLQRADGEFPQQHFAFTIEEDDIEKSLARLTEAGVEHRPPVFHDWMPGTSIYFSDPDGHDLELFAPQGAKAP